MSADEKQLSAALRRLERYSGVLQELSHLWPEADRQSMWWDRYNGVLATPGATDTYRALFGNDLIRFGRSASAYVRTRPFRLHPRRWKGPVEVGPGFPRDAVVMSRSRPIVMSARAGQVLKINPEGDRTTWARELEALNIAHSAGLGEHVPALRGSGSTEVGPSWLLTQLVPNTKPFSTRFEHLLLPTWRRWLRRDILPFMGRFYHASGVDYVCPDDVVDHTTSLAEPVLSGDSLQTFRQLVVASRPRGPASTLAIANVHGDFSASHIHRAGEDWWLIDWGNCQRQEVLTDFFTVHLSRTGSRSERMKAFWQWLRGECYYYQLPRSFREDVVLFLSFYESTFRDSISESALRYHVLASLYRSCIGIIVNSAKQSSINIDQFGTDRPQGGPLGRCVSKMHALGIFKAGT